MALVLGKGRHVPQSVRISLGTVVWIAVIVSYPPFARVITSCGKAKIAILRVVLKWRLV